MAEHQNMDAKTFFRELKRRNVLKVAIAYAVIAWLVIEATSLLLFGHEERSSAMTALMVIVAIGFGVILYISWAFEATPEGMKRTASVPPDAMLPSWSPRKFAVFVITIALLAASLLVFDLVRSRTKPTSSPATAPPRTPILLSLRKTTRAKIPAPSCRAVPCAEAEALVKGGSDSTI